MRYIFSVIHDRSNSGTPEEIQRIDVFNEKLIAGGHRILAQWQRTNGPGSEGERDARRHVARVAAFTGFR